MNSLETPLLHCNEIADADSPRYEPLRDRVKQALNNYFAQLDGHEPANVYDMVLEEIEIPLLECVMQYTRGNQSKAAILLGISRGTLRKKIAKYNIS